MAIRGSLNTALLGTKEEDEMSIDDMIPEGPSIYDNDFRATAASSAYNKPSRISRLERNTTALAQIKASTESLGRPTETLSEYMRGRVKDERSERHKKRVDDAWWYIGVYGPIVAAAVIISCASYIDKNRNVGICMVRPPPPPPPPPRPPKATNHKIRLPFYLLLPNYTAFSKLSDIWTAYLHWSDCAFRVALC